MKKHLMLFFIILVNVFGVQKNTDQQEINHTQNTLTIDSNNSNMAPTLQENTWPKVTTSTFEDGRTLTISREGRVLTLPDTLAGHKKTWKSGATTATLSGDRETLTISGKGAMKNYNDIPPWFEPVGSLNVMTSRWPIRSVVIKEGVTSIGDRAFSDLPLTSVTIPNTVRVIGFAAFADCWSLKTVTIPNSVVEIKASAFAGCWSLASISIPNSVKTIEYAAFAESKELRTVTIPNSVTTMGKKVFNRCHRLTSIDVAADNPNYSSKDGVLFNKNKTLLMQYPSGKTGAYTIPNSVIEIEEAAFLGSYGLTSVTIPSSVTTIGDRAFASRSSSTPLRIMFIISLNPIPPTIGTSAFNRATSTCLYVPANSIDAYRNSRWGHFFKCVEDLASAPDTN